MLKISEEVQTALWQKTPIIALETAILTHGMPYPINYKTAQKAQQICRENNVVPATVCLQDGFIKIGLTDNELKALAEEANTQKASVCDIPYMLSKKMTAGTTVAATMFAAEKAGIEVFGTGGIGGVHRGAETTFDISADLRAFYHHRVIVVSAGAKAVLDLPKTLECLQSLSVPFYGYQTNFLPAFYSADSPYPVNRIENYEEIAESFILLKKLDLKSGMLIFNPVPKQDEIPFNIVEQLIYRAVEELRESHISGKDVTPFLLRKLVELSGGKTIPTNVALVENNIKVACGIALALQKLQ